MLDTHAWLWWTDAPRRLSRPAAQTINRASRVAISSISVFELVSLAEEGRIALDAPARTWVRGALHSRQVEVLPVTTEVAVDAAQLRAVRDPFDRLIYATARAEDALLVTRDERLRRLDPERTVW